MNTYIFNGQSHTDYTSEYMLALGMSEEQMESAIQQKVFEHSQNLEKRQTAYITESDPLYMEWQFDQTPASEQAWRDKVEEIKLKYPLPNS